MEENGIEYRINTHGPHVQHGFALGPDCFNNEYVIPFPESVSDQI